MSARHGKLMIPGSEIRGVFWIIENRLYSFPFKEESQIGVAKSGRTYNHKLLWPYVRPEGCRKPYNYYPRGRVDYTGKGKPIIYMSRHISLDFIPGIIKNFELKEEPVIKIDGSNHYLCHLDSEWGSNKSDRGRK